MTHRDGFPRLSARSAWRGDAGHRKPCAPSECHRPSESPGKPPFRSRGRTAGGRRKALTMPRRTHGLPLTRPMVRRIACPTGAAASQGFRTHSFETGRMATDVPHRYATRFWPKTLGSRLYGSLSGFLGISAVDRNACRFRSP